LARPWQLVRLRSRMNRALHAFVRQGVGLPAPSAQLNAAADRALGPQPWLARS
jgi:hypothetical protein